MLGLLNTFFLMKINQIHILKTCLKINIIYKIGNTYMLSTLLCYNILTVKCNIYFEIKFLYV